MQENFFQKNYFKKNVAKNRQKGCRIKNEQHRIGNFQNKNSYIVYHIFLM